MSLIGLEIRPHFERGIRGRRHQTIFVRSPCCHSIWNHTCSLYLLQSLGTGCRVSVVTFRFRPDPRVHIRCSVGGNPRIPLETRPAGASWRYVRFLRHVIQGPESPLRRADGYPCVQVVDDHPVDVKKSIIPPRLHRNQRSQTNQSRKTAN